VTERVLVIENDPTDDPRRLGDWLTAAGLTLDLVRPPSGDPLPAGLDGYAGLVVLGGDQHVYPATDGTPGANWFPRLESLLRKAVRQQLPTLGICLGAQLLAQAHGGTVAPAAAGPEIGPRLVARRDAADRDPLFAAVPMLPDVLQWHSDEVTELPAGAVLLAASPDYPHQAFRLGPRAWGVQFHIECDTAMIADWTAGSASVLADQGLSAQLLIDRAQARMDDLARVWRPFAQRFAALVRGEEPAASDPHAPGLGPAPGQGRELPLLGL
jgi:GMP synthase-like glutamine amidotransferase